MQNSQETASRIKLQAKLQKVVLKDMLQSLDLGINTISDISCGKEVSYITFAKIAEYLNCSADYFLGRTDDPTTHIQTAHTIFSNNNGVKGGIGNNSHISIGGANSEDLPDEQLQELIKLYSGLSTRKKAELLILVDDFVKASDNTN